jgi:hypothetical protein
MDNIRLWLIILFISTAIFGISLSIISFSKNKAVLGFIPQVIALFISFSFSIWANLTGGWEALGFIILSAILFISAVLSATATLAAILIKKKSLKGGN